MAEKSYLIGVDLGTAGTKAAIFLVPLEQRRLFLMRMEI